jgi:hypothetical protein
MKQYGICAEQALALGLIGLLVGLAGGALTACSKSDPNEAKLMPKLAPPPTVELPADLRIEVEIDGQAAPPIDRQKLMATPPDFADEERRAWRLPTVLGAVAAPPTTTVFAAGAQDVSVELKTRRDDGLIGVIIVSRRGDVVAAMVDEKTPFPQFHGQGGRLGRPPDPLPRVLKLSKLRVVSVKP